MNAMKRRGIALILKQRLTRVLAICAFVFLQPVYTDALIAGPALQETKAIKVHDGDTVTLMFKGKMKKARLIGIDAPEMNQRPWGRQAKERLIDILNHTDWTVFVETDVVKHDKYGRPLVYLWTKNKELINELMIGDGYAALFTIRPNVKYAAKFRQAAQRARRESKGIWGPNGLKEAPARYREKHPRKGP